MAKLDHPSCAQHFFNTFPKYSIFTQAKIDCLTNNETKNALHDEMVILNYNLTLNWVWLQFQTAKFIFNQHLGLTQGMLSTTTINNPYLHTSS